MCIGGFQNILIPPSDKARRIADFMRIAVLLHFILSLFLMLCGRFIDGIFDVLGCLIGYLSIRNQDGYSFQQILCYCVFCGMDVFWALLRLILYFSGATSTETSSPAVWQYYIFVITLIVAPFIYVFATVVSYYLYKELRNIVNEMTQQMDDASAGGGSSYFAPSGGAPPPQVLSGGGGSMWRHAESHPNNNNNVQPTGFRAFSGPGHRLG